MSPETVAKLTLAAYGLAAVGLFATCAARCPNGWRIWVLHVVNRIYGCCCFHWRANRRCPFLQAKPAILIANHRSPMDPVFIAGDPENVRPLGCMMAREYYEIGSLRFINTGHECIPVARNGRDQAATRAALRRLQQGKLVTIFPEGGINTGPGLLPANPGVAWLALRSRAPVYPVFIQNAPTGETMVEPFFRFNRVRVIYGDPIDLTTYYDQELTGELMEHVTSLMMSQLGRLGGIDVHATVRRT